MPQPLQAQAAAAAGNEVFFAGGYTNSGTASNVVDILHLPTYTTISSSSAYTLWLETTVSGRMALSLPGGLDLAFFRLNVGSMSGNAPIDLGSGTLTTGGDNTNTTYAGKISDAGTLVKVGSGTLLLTASNTYTGPTTINQGSLVVNGSIVSPVTVNSGGALGGAGYLTSVTVNAGGTLAPGDSLGVLHLSGNLVLASSSSVLDYELGANTYDRLAVSGSVMLNGALNVNLVGGFAPSAGESFDLISGKMSGSFRQVNLPPLGNGLSWDTSNLYSTGTINVVPEPSSLMLLGVGTLGLLSYRWRRRKRPL